jgi:uncharacterized protein YegL
MKSYTHIAMVLDRSGSMQSLRNEIIGGFNAFIEEQKNVEGKATVTLVQFDNEIDRMADFKPLPEIDPLTEKTYVPRGMTKLYDAIGLTVKTVQESIANLKKGKPDKVLVLILTDGLENSSQEYDTAAIRGLLDERQKDGWEFSFIGANQDAVLTAKGLGLRNPDANITYSATKEGAESVLRSMSRATATYRCAAKGVAMAYTQEDRDAQSIDPAASAKYVSHSIRTEPSRESGKLGGAMRSDSLTPKRRSEIASRAAKVRWSSKSV